MANTELSSPPSARFSAPTALSIIYPTPISFSKRIPVYRPIVSRQASSPAVNSLYPAILSVTVFIFSPVSGNSSPGLAPVTANSFHSCSTTTLRPAIFIADAHDLHEGQATPPYHLPRQLIFPSSPVAIEIFNSCCFFAVINTIFFNHHPDFGRSLVHLPNQQHRLHLARHCLSPVEPIISVVQPIHLASVSPVYSLILPPQSPPLSPSPHSTITSAISGPTRLPACQRENIIIITTTNTGNASQLHFFISILPPLPTSLLIFSHGFSFPVLGKKFSNAVKSVPLTVTAPSFQPHHFQSSALRRCLSLGHSWSQFWISQGSLYYLRPGRHLPHYRFRSCQSFQLLYQVVSLLYRGGIPAGYPYPPTHRRGHRQ